MSKQDRTHEFRACIESINKRTALGNRGLEAKQRLLQTKSVTKGEFTSMATSISKDISSTGLKLNKLAQLAKRKTLFDDRPVEISELTFIIKQDIANINKQIASLQAYVRQRHSQQGSVSPEAKMINDHTQNVLMMLQNSLATTSMTFKDVLELRTQNMKESKNRTEQFMYTTQTAANNQSTSLLYNQKSDPMGDGSANPYDQKGKGRAQQNGDMLALDLNAAEEGGGSNGFMQMQMVEQQDSYIQQRSTAIESIETTIAELGQIFTQLANMVAEQRETVQRIDADVDDVMANVSGGHRELLKYYASISSNRWLMLKVFGILIVFFLVFILVS